MAGQRQRWPPHKRRPRVLPLLGGRYLSKCTMYWSASSTTRRVSAPVRYRVKELWKSLRGDAWAHERGDGAECDEDHQRREPSQGVSHGPLRRRSVVQCVARRGLGFESRAWRVTDGVGGRGWIAAAVGGQHRARLHAGGLRRGRYGARGAWECGDAYHLRTRVCMHRLVRTSRRRTPTLTGGATR